MKKYRCLCCGYWTLSSQGKSDICPVCFWEDDFYFIPEHQKLYHAFCSHHITIEDIYHDPSFADWINQSSSANHNLTLKQAHTNYLTFGACEQNMLPYVRTPLEHEQ